MKIAIVGPAYPYRGGIADYNERLAKALTMAGHNVEIYTFTLQYPSFLFPGKSQYSKAKAPENLKINRLINSVNPFNWLKAGIRLKKAKHDLLIVRFWLPFMGPALGTILRLIKGNRKTKIISIADNIIPHESRPGDRLFTHYFLKPVDGLLAMSKTVLEDIDQFDKQKPRVLSPHPLYDNFGEAISRELAIKKLGLNPEDKILLFFGLIRDYKGLDILIKAFADERFRGENYRLVIAGEYYSNAEYYKGLITENKLEEEVVEVDGFIPSSMVATYFSAADLVVQPYKSATQSGVTQIAYHFNKPMVVTNVGGLKEMCPNGKVGYVVPTEPKAIADAILKYFEEADKEQITRNIIQEKQKYSWEILVENILHLYKSLPS